MKSLARWPDENGDSEDSDDGFPSEQEVTRSYRSARFEYRKLVRRVKAISRGTGGISSTGNQMFWSSVLFTRLTVLAESIQELCPEIKPDSHWDCSSVFSLTRNLAECYFVAHFLCFDDVDDDERQARFLMMHIHDAFSRKRMLNELDMNNYEEHAWAYAHWELETRIRQTHYFNSLPESRQRTVLKGDRTPFIQDEILDRMGLDRQSFRGMYRLLSSHTHTGPIAFYRMSETGRGCGVECRSEKGYSAIALGMASQLMTRACDDILKIFPNAEARGSKVSPRNITKHLNSLKQAQIDGAVIDP